MYAELLSASIGLYYNKYIIDIYREDIFSWRNVCSESTVNKLVCLCEYLRLPQLITNAIKWDNSFSATSTTVFLAIR